MYLGHYRECHQGRFRSEFRQYGVGGQACRFNPTLSGQPGIDFLQRSIPLKLKGVLLLAFQVRTAIGQFRPLLLRPLLLGPEGYAALRLISLQCDVEILLQIPATDQQ